MIVEGFIIIVLFGVTKKRRNAQKKNKNEWEEEKNLSKAPFIQHFSLSLLLTRIFIEIIFLHSPLDVFIVTRLDLNLSFFFHSFSLSLIHIKLQLIFNFGYDD